MGVVVRQVVLLVGQQHVLVGRRGAVGVAVAFQDGHVELGLHVAAEHAGQLGVLRVVQGLAPAGVGGLFDWAAVLGLAAIFEPGKNEEIFEFFFLISIPIYMDCKMVKK